MAWYLNVHITIINDLCLPGNRRLSPSISLTLPLSTRKNNTSLSVSCNRPTLSSWTSNVPVRGSLKSYAFIGQGLIVIYGIGCFAITTVFSHAQTVVLCGSCASVLCQPTGGKAR